jgi:UDP-N-acetyl-D-glucosamine/UDP-N-acetyl-D-galactosamine dehydrogenase
MNIAIMGAGYVGLPLAIAFSKFYPVICFDIDKKRIEQLQKGYDSNKQHVKKEIIKKSLIFSYDRLLIEKKDIYIITVPTPINRSNKPDLSMLKSVSLLVGKLIKKDSIIVYESTTYPGCTEEFCIPLLESTSGLKYQKDFQVAYSPERVNPGDKINTLKSITKIVAANDKNTLLRVKKLYQKVSKSIFCTNSIKVGESAKVIENIQRDINIAFVNELSVLFKKLNISTNEVLKAAATKWNFHYYKPGLVGGHCISVDPYYLAYKAKQNNYYPELILSGRKFNENMGGHVAKETIKLLKLSKINNSKANIAVLGFSFKENIPDIRNTKIIQIIKSLKKKNIGVKIFDPIVSKSEVKKVYNLNIYNFRDLKKFKYDAILLAVSHRPFLKKLSYYSQFYKNKKNKIFIDLKNNYSVYSLKNEDFKYFQL